MCTFSRAMALRRLHWRNNLLGEALYLVNVVKVSQPLGVLLLLVLLLLPAAAAGGCRWRLAAGTAGLTISSIGQHSSDGHRVHTPPPLPSFTPPHMLRSSLAGALPADRPRALAATDAGPPTAPHLLLAVLGCVRRGPTTQPA